MVKSEINHNLQTSIELFKHEIKRNWQFYQQWYSVNLMILCNLTRPYISRYCIENCCILNPFLYMGTQRQNSNFQNL